MSESSSQSESEQDDIPPLEREVRYLPGVGPHRAKLLDNLDIETVQDLLWNVPRDVLDLSQVSSVNDLTDDRIHTIRGTVVDVDARTISRGRTLTAAVLRTDEGLVKGVWFNQPWMPRQLNSDQWVLWSAKPKFRDNRWEMSNPRLQWLDADDASAQGIVLTKYGLTEGLKQEALRSIIAAALETAGDAILDDLPERFRKHYKLPLLADAIKMLHQPESVKQFLDARRRLVFDEQLDFQLGLALRRRVRKTTEQSPVIEVTPKIDARIRRLFEFELTDGQEQAIAEISEDLNQSRPMHRLFQADVGAGKTVVAIYAMLASIAAGTQAVLMAPTELLARQHWNTINQILIHSKVKRCLLTGNLTAAQRKESLRQIAAGEVQLIIGTQAVIQKDVDYHQLGLVVIDEQHKFGVIQRARFSGTALAPHVLVMTATPIPRSLCLTQYGDLELTIMSEMPPGRQTVVTSRVRNPKVEAKAW
ncbi:MAG: DEAD/DEAH box helicase, partial [Planctomycetaceae bacterium]|nr:DEAD/DEAH box helicase [Planctomycetaceae bacterium]